MAQLLFGLLASFVLTASGPRPPRYHYLEIPYAGNQQLKALQEEGWDIGGIDLERNTVTLVVEQEQLVRTSGLEVVSRREVRAPDENYKSPEEVEELLFEMETRYPHLVTIHNIGQSVEGKDILAANVTARFVIPSGGRKPTVLFDSMHHAREIMTPEITLDIIDYLTSRYDSDPKVRDWLNRFSIWVVPMVNPDGNRRVWSSSSMWRKNTRGGYGVDVNRNYPHDWNTCNGSSGNKSAEDYRGDHGGSEPETQAIMQLASAIKPKFNISYHSFSEIVIFPFGCRPKRIPAPDRQVYEGVGRELARRLIRDSGNGSYRAGTSYELLYNVDGGSVDWMYAKEKIMAFVIEVNSSSLGFQPSYSRWREETVRKQRPGWLYILEQMDGPGLGSRR